MNNRLEKNGGEKLPENVREREDASKGTFFQSIGRITKRMVDAVMTKKVYLNGENQGPYRQGEDQSYTVPSRFADVIRSRKTAFALGLAAGVAAVPAIRYGQQAFSEKNEEFQSNENIPGVTVVITPSLASSQHGWVETQKTSPGFYIPGKSVQLNSADGISAVCATLYGQKNMVTCNNGPCTYMNANQTVLKSKHDPKDKDKDYLSSGKAVRDAAKDLVDCSTHGFESCGGAFIDRGVTSNSTIQDQSPVADTQFQIACALTGFPEVMNNNDHCNDMCGPGTVCNVSTGMCVLTRP